MNTFNHVLSILIMSTTAWVLPSYASVSTSTNGHFNVYWQPTKVGDALPNDAIVMAYGSDGPLYFCSTSYNQGVQPGQWTDKGCLISYGGSTHLISNFVVLSGDKQHTTWLDPKKNNNQPIIHLTGMLLPGLPLQNMGFIQPLLGGYESSGHTSAIRPSPNAVYFPSHQNNGEIPLCRVIYNDSIHLGKVVRNNCNISFNQHEKSLSGFQQLYYQSQPTTQP